MTTVTSPNSLRPPTSALFDTPAKPSAGSQYDSTGNLEASRNAVLADAGWSVPEVSVPVFFDTIRIDVSNPRGVSVRDVLHRLYRELSKRAEPVEIMRASQAKGVQTAAQGHAARRIDLLAPSVFFAGLNYSGEAFSLLVRP